MKIYVGNLHYRASRSALYALFVPFGYVQLIEIRMLQDGSAEGVAFVYMKGRHDGTNAIHQLDGMNFMNRFLQIFEIEE
ncbi:RNA-binding protein 39 [Chitinophaga skermanii]|uniref:RNA-binding protein 39 n=1 Tax=Chitinophaga skermanii TaxID=331697 RepID=A0A327QUP8_9BACT|nr:RNA-binding protein [Chitinophaga skermanii]RAJ08339.1 RNA-binding protein 39 [Chitinophaga skermanii]